MLSAASIVTDALRVSIFRYKKNLHYTKKDLYKFYLHTELVVDILIA